MIENEQVLFKETSPWTQISSQLDINRVALLQQYNQTLKETLFENSSQIRLAMLPSAAAREVDALIGYFQNPSTEIAVQHGVELCKQGFSEQTLLRLGSVSRQFFLAHLEKERLSVAIAILDNYHAGLLHGFVRTRENTVFNEQDEIRKAIFKSLSRYSIQMELVAGVTLVINSVFNLDDLLTTTVKLISDEFHLFYVGVFLASDENRRLTLSSGFGDAQENYVDLFRNYPFEVGDASLIAQCMVDRKPKIALELTSETIEGQATWYPPGSRSAIACPLIARGNVIGVLVCYSEDASAFSDHDAAALGMLSDQLANAIENSHLFSGLQLSEKKYRTILDAIQEGYFEMDLNGHFTFANPTVCAILGYPEVETLNVDYREFIAPEHIDRLERAFARVKLAGNAGQSIEHKVVRKDSTVRVVESYISISQNIIGQVIGFRGILRDITRRKESEKYLIEHKALERSNQELEQFAYVASHDLQEPLRKIQAFGDRLKITSATQLNAEGLDSLERIMKSANRMSVLINDLLNLSRVKTQADPFVPIDLNLVVQDVLSDLEGLVERTGGVVQVEDLLVINADPLQMRQLLQNLIGNALKFHKPNQPPVIKVSCQIVGDPSISNTCQIIVSDNGIGFDEKYQERIFQLFQRLHTSKEYEGTGIGLSICRSIVERHHGQLTAHSAKGEGATFVITLPIYEKNDWENHE